MVEPALTRLTQLTAGETQRLDRAIVDISGDQELGTEVPGTLLRDVVACVGEVPCHLVEACHCTEVAMVSGF
ncbi:hypothetical protein [Streptomyces sp. NPDC047130]|uniref:hypothetical protein n=1 Tax=Streptomyces sp. NPDC047130 TaxID=3155261 RepID=UPI0033F84A04